MTTENDVIYFMQSLAKKIPRRLNSKQGESTDLGGRERANKKLMYYGCFKSVIFSIPISNCCTGITKGIVTPFTSTIA